jgi:amidohydrolase
MPLLEKEQRETLIALRRDFHMYPEIAHHEFRTAGVVAERLRTLGLDEVRTGVGTTGVVGTLRGGLPGPTVLLRADMGALPLQEEDRGQPYRSRNEGAHHACGHDGHMAILLTVAETLKTRQALLPGTVRFVFQPAEETVGGAEGMLRDGALGDPPAEACFALHLWNHLRVGEVDVRPGPVFASADAFTIRLDGRGGHGAMPHQTADPIVAASYLVTALQTLVSREVSPFAPAIVTIGSIHGGTAPNIIPSRVEMRGTLRAFDTSIREHLMERLDDLVREISHTFRLEGMLAFDPGGPACVNDSDMAALVQATAKRLFGESAVTSRVQTAGADDMSLFLQAVPGCYFLVGSANPEVGLDAPHHCPAFDIDERALEVGAKLMTQVALDFLRTGYLPEGVR